MCIDVFASHVFSRGVSRSEDRQCEAVEYVRFCFNAMFLCEFEGLARSYKKFNLILHFTLRIRCWDLRK